MRAAVFAAVVMLAAGCAYSHYHPGLGACHAHAAAPGHTLHDHGAAGVINDRVLYDADGKRGVGVSGPCEAE